jgi:hypothetical protein
MLRRPRRRTATLAYLISTITMVRVAAADRVGVQGTFTGDVAWTDNVMNAPRNAPASLNLVPPVSDFFFEVRPGIILSTAAPRVVTNTSYAFQADLFATQTQGNSYSNTLRWEGFFLPSANADVLVGALAQQGRLNTFNLTAPSASAPVNVFTAQATATNFVSATAVETLVDRLAGNWIVTQSVSGRAWISLDQGTLPNSYEGIALVGADHRWKLDALGFNLRLDFIDYDAVRSATTDAIITPPRPQMFNRLTVRWRRDWTNFWNTEAQLGVVEANGFGSMQSGVIFQPAALAAVRYVHRRGTGELSYSHDVQPDAIAGNTYSFDQGLLRGTLPFPERSHLFLSGTVAYQHARRIDFMSGLSSSTAEVIVADASLSYMPRPEVSVFLRYSLWDQIGHPQEGSQAALDIERQVAMVGVTVVYPASPVARTPSQSSILNGRVDGGDVNAIPEPHSPPPQSK